MSVADWREVEQVLAEVMDLPVSERAARIAQLCGDRFELRAEVESLLTAREKAGSFLDINTEVEDGAAAVFSLEGKHLGPYRLLAIVGVGGMGTVYRAERTDGRFQKQVAIKVMPMALHSPELLRRFTSEQQILAGLEHANIARMLDAGVSPEGIPYFVMEYVEGVPVNEYCNAHQLSARERLVLFQSLCDAVHYAHQHLVVHRDLKPANILVSAEGVPKLLDFGIAKIIAPWTAGIPEATRSLLHPMTPGYASPEQVRAATITTAADIYSLGVVLYELMTGQAPYRVVGRPLDEAIRIICESEPEKPSAVIRRRGPGRKPPPSSGVLSSDLDAIIAKALRKDPQQRYGSAEELSSDIGRALDGLPVSAQRGTLRYRTAKFVRRHRFGVGVVVAAAGLLVGFATIMAVQAHRIAEERDRANREAEASRRVTEFMTHMFKVSDPNEARANSITAREILDNASSEIESGLAKYPNLQARMMHVMGRSYLSLGLYTRAQSLLERGIAASQYGGKEENREALGMRQDLGWTLWQQGRLAEAESLSRKLLAAQRHVLGPEDPDTLRTIGQLATILNTEGNHAEAVKLGREALDEQKRILGPEAFDTLSTADNLVGALDQNGQLADAEKLEQETLEIQHRVYGPENLGTISSMINMADIERDLGRAEEAKKLFRQALDVEARVLGPDQPETAQTRYDFACLFARSGQVDEALALLRQAIDHGLPPRVLSGIANDSCFEPVRKDSRFVALVAHRQTGTPH